MQSVGNDETKLDQSSLSILEKIMFDISTDDLISQSKQNSLPNYQGDNLHKLQRAIILSYLEKASQSFDQKLDEAMAANDLNAE
jgi:hypothetical protein